MMTATIILEYLYTWEETNEEDILNLLVNLIPQEQRLELCALVLPHYAAQIAAHDNDYYEENPPEYIDDLEGMLTTSKPGMQIISLYIAQYPAMISILESNDDYGDICVVDTHEEGATLGDLFKDSPFTLASNQDVKLEDVPGYEAVTFVDADYLLKEGAKQHTWAVGYLPMKQMHVRHSDE